MLKSLVAIMILTQAAGADVSAAATLTGGLVPNQSTIAQETASNPAHLGPHDSDPRQFLEEITGPEALKWAEAHNESTLGPLKADPRFESFRTTALDFLNAHDRIAMPGFSTAGHVDNFWQDSEHTHGLWRRSSLKAYLDDQPDWEAVLDIDALSRLEKMNWVYKGATCLAPDQRFCLISLSDGGKDAVFIREYDSLKRAFVPGGFSLPEGKQSASWVDADTIHVAREWKPGEVTQSGYAYVTKVLKRGQGLDQAVEVFRGETTDVAAGRSTLLDPDGHAVIDMTTRALDFFHTRYGFVTDKGEVRLNLPEDSSFETWFHGWLIWSLRSDYTTASGQVFTRGSVIGLEMASALAHPDKLAPVLIYAPDSHSSVQSIHQTRNRLILSLLSDVKGQIRTYSLKDGHFSAQTLDLPENSNLGVVSTDDQSDQIFASATGFTQPTSLYHADLNALKPALVRQSPTRFDATGLEVHQFWATSTDGTKVPYFLVSRADLKHDGTTPTLLYAYGGFEVSLQPSYSAAIGKLWLERGGAYVLANIRGGGEFGPDWHTQGLKIHRQRIYDDFQSVAQDLMQRGLTSPRHLGIMGGSNGGLLTGVQLTERPDLWNAVVIEVPLLDMIRFPKLGAGASWQGEYGHPDDATEGAFLKSISPYHNVRAGTAYPTPFIDTSTRDDRVHPGHARKFAALLEDMKVPFYYYENINGGHAAAANANESAVKIALIYTYLSQRLMDR